MRILSLDQSTTATGVAMFIDGVLTDYALIKPKASKKVETVVAETEAHFYGLKMPEEMYNTTLLRTTAIADVIEALIKQFKPDVVYFEEIYENRNPSGYRSLARLQGFIAHICHKNNVRYVIVEESKWINSFGTYTKEQTRSDRKSDIMQKINDLYDLEIKIDEVS